MTIRAIIDTLRLKAYRRYLENPEIIKTVAYYRRALRRAVLDFYRAEIDAFEFIGDMIRLIKEQFTRAWNEGAREVGKEPKDMTEEDAELLQERIDQEQEFILGYASDIETAAAARTPIAPLYNRVELWVNRYNEVKAEAMIHFGKRVKLEWQLGETEDHCATCLKLNGTVAFAFEWEQSGVRPQSAPNPVLECGGWNCDCRLEVTQRRRTRLAINKLLSIATEIYE